MTERTPSVRPTTIGSVAVAAIVGGGLTFAALQALLLGGGTLPALGASAWLPELLAAGLTGWMAWVTRQAVQIRREPLEAATAVTRLQLGKASVLAGACLAAAFLALVATATEGLPAALAQARILHGSIAAALSVAWAACGSWLERNCRIPHDEDADSPPSD